MTDQPADAIPELRDALADADGRVRVAEARLAALDPAEPTTAPARVDAEERVAAARRAASRIRARLIAAETTVPAVEQESAASPDRVPAFENVADFVDAYLLEHWRRESIIWCTTWWRHSEAFDRLRALWLAWEASRYEGPFAMAAWWRDYADPTMAVLTANGGPFAHCEHSTGKHELLKRVQADPPPAGLLDS